MKILVTGGAGYIGSHACKALARAGHEPIAYDNMSTGHAWAVKWGPLERGDILDTQRLSAVMEHHRPGAVMHFAALAYVGESVLHPDRYYKTNVVGTLSLLNTMRDHRISKLIFSSTCASYGVPATLPIAETAPQSPVNPYGRSKRMAEQILQDYSSAHGLGVVALRYFNAAGADNDGDIGEEHMPETHLIPLVLQAAAGLREGVEVFGSDYPTPDGTCVRDYVHVSDLASAHVTALGACRLGSFDAYNLGGGRGVSVAEIIEVAKLVTGREIRVRLSERREGDPPILVADSTRARDELGWRQEYPEIESMISTAWRWLREKRSGVGLSVSDRQFQ